MAIIENPKQASENHFIWIDILRGFAAIGVVLFHSRVDLWVGWQEISQHPSHYSLFDRIIAWLSIPLPFLGSGVMLFFLVSGFCIHYPTALHKKIKIRSYATRRLLRLLPPYFAAVFVTLFTEFLCSKFSNQTISKDLTIWKTLLMIQNYPPSPGQLNSNASLWSLPVEFELYLFYPLVFLLSKKLGSKKTFAIVAIVSLVALVLTVTWFPWLEGNFMKYWIIWCSGSLLAHLVKNNKLPQWKHRYFIPMFLAFIISGITVKMLPYVIGHFIWAVGYFFLLWFCLSGIKPSYIFNKLLLKKLVWLGQISYSLYLIHFPLFHLMGALWIYWKGNKPSNLLISFLATIICVVISAGFHALIEKPSHNLARNVAERYK